MKYCLKLNSLRKLAQCESRKYYSTIESIERAVGKHAANTFITSMDKNSKFIDVPTICVHDPANVETWKWEVGLGSRPKMSIDELTKMGKSLTDPFKLVEKDISTLSGGIKELLGSDHPVLETCAKYFFDIDGGKKIRPTMVLAVSYALNASLNNNDLNLYALPSQKRLAEISEMIHTASLFHDDVIDKASTRRGVPSVNQIFGNKLAILGGDFLLSRASISLARLRNIEVVELLSTVIEHLVKGEVMQMKPSTIGNSAMEYYLRKNFYKTASLMGHSCLAASVLGGHNEETQRATYLYGTYVGQAFQLIDDALDFEGSTATIGKAPLADLKSGLATAPTLFAALEYPIIEKLINRKFEYEGDVEHALELVQKSNGLKLCKDLAQVHAEKAIEAISSLNPSIAKDSLVALACKVVTRTS
jgi:geranylgeranyl pyrophosphate synthase